MIDESRTFDIYGYTSGELTRGSGKHVVAVCDDCGKYRVLRYYCYRELCPSCCQKGKVGSFYGKHHSYESRKKMAKSQTGRCQSEVTKRKVSAAQQGIRYDDWESYACKSPYCPLFNNDCKESNRDKYGRRCFICGLPESENITKNGKHLKLAVHHVDMNKQQGCDGVRWKLVPICLKHHRKSHSVLWTARIKYLLDCVWNKQSC